MKITKKNICDFEKGLAPLCSSSKPGDVSASKHGNLHLVLHNGVNFFLNEHSYYIPEFSRNIIEQFIQKSLFAATAFYSE